MSCLSRCDLCIYASALYMLWNTSVPAKHPDMTNGTSSDDNSTCLKGTSGSPASLACTCRHLWWTSPGHWDPACPSLPPPPPRQPTKHLAKVHSVIRRPRGSWFPVPPLQMPPCTGRGDWPDLCYFPSAICIPQTNDANLAPPSPSNLHSPAHAPMHPPSQCPCTTCSVQSCLLLFGT